MERLAFSSSSPALPFSPSPTFRVHGRLLYLPRASIAFTSGYAPSPLPRLVSPPGGCAPSARRVCTGSFCLSRLSVRCLAKGGEGPPAAATSEAPCNNGQGPGALLRKVASAGLVVLFSAVIVSVIQPLVAPPAYANFQTAATRSGGLVRTEVLSSAWTGFFAGCLHTLSGPDHLAALAPLSIGRTRMESAIVGGLWGCGHDAGQVIFGMLFLLLKDRLHIEIIRTWGTRVVGLTLLVIGAMGIKEASEMLAPCVDLENGECDVRVVEAVEGGAAAPSGKKKIGLATFATGIVHGLQPDALMMVLPALALPSRVAGAAFLCMFLVGTVVAMGSYTVFLGSCSQALKERVPRITEKLTWASSLIAISMGLGILISQLFGFSLY